MIKLANHGKIKQLLISSEKPISKERIDFKIKFLPANCVLQCFELILFTFCNNVANNCQLLPPVNNEISEFRTDLNVLKL